MPGTYQLVATSAEGCTETATTTVSSPASFSIDLPADYSLGCTGGSVTLTGTVSGSGAFGYAWFRTDGGTPVNLNNDQPSYTTSQPGTYEWVVTDADGCTQTAVTVVTGATPVTASLPVAHLLPCDASAAVLTVTASGGAPFTYAWYRVAGGTSINLLNNQPSLSTTAPGNYTVEVTNADGCTATASTTLSSPGGFNVDLPGTFVNGCDADLVDVSATVTGNGNYTYLWQTTTGATVSTSATFQTATPGLYYLTVTDQQTGCTQTASTVVSLVAPTLSAPATLFLPCGVSSIPLTPTVGGITNYSLTYTATNANGAPIPVGTPTPTGLAVTRAGIYTTILTDTERGCTYTATTVVTDWTGGQPLQYYISGPAQLGPMDTAVYTINYSPTVDSLRWELGGSSSSVYLTPTDQSQVVLAAGPAIGEEETLRVRLYYTGCPTPTVASAVIGISDNPISTDLPPVLQPLVSPNPTSGEVYVAWPATPERTSLTLYDLHGRQLLHRTVDTARERLELSAYPPGVYLLRVRSGAAENMLRVVRQ